MLIGRYDFENVFKRKDTATAERTRFNISSGEYPVKFSIKRTNIAIKST